MNIKDKKLYDDLKSEIRAINYLTEKEQDDLLFRLKERLLE